MGKRGWLLIPVEIVEGNSGTFGCVVIAVLGFLAYALVRALVTGIVIGVVSIFASSWLAWAIYIVVGLFTILCLFYSEDWGTRTLFIILGPLVIAGYSYIHHGAINMKSRMEVAEAEEERDQKAARAKALSRIEELKREIKQKQDYNSYRLRTLRVGDPREVDDPVYGQNSAQLPKLTEELRLLKIQNGIHDEN
jgi:hypothetical protein